MYFNHPLFLLLLTFPLVLFIYSLRSKKQTLNSVFSLAILKIISVNTQIIDTGLKYKLFLLVIVLFVLALAQPVWNQTSITNTQKSIPLVIALDISKSMLKDDLYPSRLELALSKIDTIMKSDTNLRVGLLLFANNAYLAHPLSEDKSSVLFISQSIDYSKIMQKSTNLFAALEGATLMLKNYKSKNLLILSDIAGITSFDAELNYVKENKLSVNVLSLTKESTPALETLASSSSGLYKLFSYSENDLYTMLKNLQNVTQIQESQDKSAKSTQLFYFPLLLALLLLLFIYTYGLVLKHKSLNLIVSLVLISITTQTEAALLDFYHLSSAENSFKDQQYTDALVYYKKLSQTQEILYNTANTQYKLGLYDKAIKNYSNCLGTDEIFNAKVYYNSANAYVKLKKLYLAKKYYKKSLTLVQDIQTQENLMQVTDILSKQKHKLSKEDKYKLPQRISVKKKSLQETVSSDYVVSLDTIVLSQEEKILQALKKQKPIIFLHKLNIQRRSKNVLQD